MTDAGNLKFFRITEQTDFGFLNYGYSVSERVKIFLDLLQRNFNAAFPKKSRKIRTDIKSNKISWFTEEMLVFVTT